MISLPQGVHRVVRASGRVAYYWRPGRGTPHERDYRSQWGRLPDDPQSSKFYQAIERLQRHGTTGGVDVLVKQYMASSAFERLSDASRKAYTTYLKQFCERLGHADPRDIQAKHIAALRESVAKERPGAAAAMVRVVKLLFSWATEMGVIDHNPMRDVSNRYKPNPREPWPQDAIDAIPDMEGAARAACLLALYTGQRISDICKMTSEHVEGGRISVVQQKTGKALKIRLHRDLLAVVSVEGPLVQENGKPLRPDTVRRMVTAECKRLGFDDLHFHGLRKSAVCMLLEAGCTEAEAAAVTGQSLGMVRYYAMQVNQQKLADEAIGKVDNDG